MSSDDRITVRPATLKDAGLVLGFIRELAAYEKLESHCVAKEEDLARTLFGAESSASALLAFEDGEPAGFAVYFFSYSTFLAKPGLYLEDLFVSQARRGRGIGKRLFAELLKIAHDRECGRFEWSVLDWNSPAISFYEKLGAVPQSEWVRYRLDAQQISLLATEGV